MTAHRDKNPTNASLTIIWSPPNGPSNFIECKPIYYVHIFKPGWSLNQTVVSGSSYSTWLGVFKSEHGLCLEKLNQILLWKFSLNFASQYLHIELECTFYNLNFYTNYSVQVAASVSDNEFGKRMGAWSSITSQISFSTCIPLVNSEIFAKIKHSADAWLNFLSNKSILINPALIHRKRHFQKIKIALE